MLSGTSKGAGKKSERCITDLGQTWVEASLWFQGDGVAVTHETDAECGNDLQVHGDGIVIISHLPQHVQQLLRLEGAWKRNSYTSQKVSGTTPLISPLPGQDQCVSQKTLNGSACEMNMWTTF